VNAGFFNMLFESGDHHSLAVGQRIDVDFDRVFKE